MLTNFSLKKQNTGQQRRKVENVNEQVDFNFCQEGVSEYAEIGWAKEGQRRMSLTE